jgi:CRP/FNR family transcriptional regulator, cyclic AMP receptor protein
MSVHLSVASKLRACALFRGFSASDIEGLLELAEPRHFPAGMEIVLKGDDGGAMFIIVEGEAQAVIQSPDVADLADTHFQAGDFFGEMALLQGERPIADLVAVTDCTVLTITTTLMRMLGHSFPSSGFRLAMAVLELARHRLRFVDPRARDAANVRSVHRDEPLMMARVA